MMRRDETALDAARVPDFSGKSHMMSEIDRTREWGVRGREDLAAFADTLLAAVEPYRSPAGSLITLPGTPGGYGTAVDGLEGFARTFLLAGFRVAGERGADPHGYLERYARGLAAGTDPHGTERWVRPTEHPQAKVEAASLALILDMTRPWLWEGLTAQVQEQVVTYLAEVVGDDSYPRCNWLWFRVTVETFLRSVGGPHRLDDIRADLDLHDAFYERDGWYRDGDERSYDHYIGWAMHLFPTLWARMSGADDLAAPRAARDADRLDQFLADAVHLVGADGSPLIQGRSLVYRFAAAAPYWVGALAQVPSVSLGRLRRAALGVVNHFADHGVPNQRGLLDLGWHRPWRSLAQSYSGTGSPYWASKGLLGLALPADHPVWSAPEEALPHEDADTVRTISAPGWVVSGTAADGVVRVSNHGTDHALAGSTGGDSPLYARLGYSTATFPLLDADSWLAPLDQSVVVVDSAGRRSHRSGMHTLPVQQTGSAVVAASRARAHWLRPAEKQQLHGSGTQGETTDAGTLTTVSVLHGPWEVRLVHLNDVASDAVALEAGGWALADDVGTVSEQTGPGSAVGIVLSTRTQVAHLHGPHGWTTARTEHRDDASPLGAHACVGVLTAPPVPGWYALTLGLAGTGHLPTPPSVHLDAGQARIEWADGTGTAVDLGDQSHSAPSSNDENRTNVPVRARDLEERNTQ